MHAMTSDESWGPYSAEGQRFWAERTEAEERYEQETAQDEARKRAQREAEASYVDAPGPRGVPWMAGRSASTKREAREGSTLRRTAGRPPTFLEGAAALIGYGAGWVLFVLLVPDQYSFANMMKQGIEGVGIYLLCFFAVTGVLAVVAKKFYVLTLGLAVAGLALLVLRLA